MPLQISTAWLAGNHESRLAKKITNHTSKYGRLNQVGPKMKSITLLVLAHLAILSSFQNRALLKVRSAHLGQAWRRSVPIQLVGLPPLQPTGVPKSAMIKRRSIDSLRGG
jgi:hypothetical protein